MNSFTIKDIENLSGIKAHTIRIWEQRYSFLKPQRTQTNIRYYTSEDVKTILNIALLNKYGYKISHIDKMNEGEMREKILSLTGSQAQQERIVHDLIQYMIDLDTDMFEKILDDYILARGIEKAILQIIFPFLEKIGILWLTNHVNPAQEHLVTNIIRQKLIVGIEGVSTPLKLNKKVLLFLPEGEHHEIGLLFLYYLLKSRGATVIYLGANVPMKDVEFVVQLKHPDMLYTHLSTVGQHFSFDKFIAQLSKRFAETPIVISGQLTHVYEKKIPSHFTFIKSLSEVFDFLHRL